MKKNIIRLLSFMVAVSLVFPLLVKAESDFSTEKDVLNFVRAAFQAQVALSEKPRTMKEINELLSPFLTKDYQSLFLNENLQLVDNRYITYGTDFPQFYIPFFSYSDKTKIIWNDDEIYVIEFFSEMDEGPVSYTNHYEGVLIEKKDGDWKVAAIYYDNIPDNIIQRFNETVQLKQDTTKSLKFQILHNSIFLIPIHLGLYYNYIKIFF